MVQVHVEKKVLRPQNVIWTPKLNALCITMFSSRLRSAKREAMHANLTAGSEKLFIALASAGAESRGPASLEGDVGIL